jgi:hypothetical protein
MGFFDTWSVSGITTDEAKQSEKFYILAQTICYNEDCGVSEEYLIMTSNLLNNLKDDFDSFFMRKNTSNKNQAVKFLVAIAAYMNGKDNQMWEWQAVRHLSQGLYGSMKESPSEFIQYNMPLIKNVMIQVKNYIDNL